MTKFNKAPGHTHLPDLDLYSLVLATYTSRRTSLLTDSLQPLFPHVLAFLRASHYLKALETLNYASLLLPRAAQAELKRLLKFLYLTANFSQAPKLMADKQNNSVLLDQFAKCLFHGQPGQFEESRLILNFMLNNFDELFRLPAGLQETVARRRLLAAKFGHEEPLPDRVYCKRLTAKEYVAAARDQTTKALVDLINHIVDDPQISLKQKKLKLKALQRIHPDIYQEHFADLL